MSAAGWTAGPNPVRDRFSTLACSQHGVDNIAATFTGVGVRLDLAGVVYSRSHAMQCKRGNHFSVFICTGHQQQTFIVVVMLPETPLYSQLDKQWAV